MCLIPNTPLPHPWAENKTKDDSNETSPVLIEQIVHIHENTLVLLESSLFCFLLMSEEGEYYGRETSWAQDTYEAQDLFMRSTQTCYMKSEVSYKAYQEWPNHAQLYME